MLIKTVKLLAGLCLLLPLAAMTYDLAPPELPIFYYGDAVINHEPAPEETIVSVRRLEDNAEIASTLLKLSGKYFLEVPCDNMAGQNIFFTLDGQVAGNSTCPDVSLVPSVNLDLEINDDSVFANQWTSSLIFSSDFFSTTTASVNFTPEVSGDNKEVVIGPGGLLIARESGDPAKEYELYFPPGTVITGSSAWDGSIIAPTVKATSTISVPSEEGSQSEVLDIIEIGFSGETLNFDRPVSILFPGQTGKKIGFSATGAGFTEIAAECAENSASGLGAGENECKFNGSEDLTVWTNHFTLFVVFIANPLPPAPAAPIYSGGGSSSSVPFCQKIEYAEWGACVNGTQTREIISKIPAYCELSNFNKAGLTQSCIAENPEEEGENEEAEEGGSGQVLGEKIYPDGTLIRSIDRKIYYLENGFRRHVVNQRALSKFKDLPVREVSIFTVYAYPEGKKILGYSDGDLVRFPDKKIYEIKAGKLIRVRNLQELKKYHFKKVITNLSWEDWNCLMD